MNPDTWAVSAPYHRRGCAHLALGFACMIAWFCTACGKPQSVSASQDADGEQSIPATAGRPETGTGPTETVRRAHRCRIAGDLSGLESCVVPEHRAAVRELVRATDRLVSADAELRDIVTRRLGHAAAARVDRSEASNVIGVFSHDVDVIDERIEGDRAVVTVQVSRRVPLEPVELTRRGGRWLVQTDPPIAGVADQLRELADALSAVARRVDRGQISAANLATELSSQQAPALRKLRALTVDPPS